MMPLRRPTGRAISGSVSAVLHLNRQVPLYWWTKDSTSTILHRTKNITSVTSKSTIISGGRRAADFHSLDDYFFTSLKKEVGPSKSCNVKTVDIDSQSPRGERRSESGWPAWASSVKRLLKNLFLQEPKAWSQWELQSRAFLLHRYNQKYFWTTTKTTHILEKAEWWIMLLWGSQSGAWINKVWIILVSTNKDENLQMLQWKEGHVASATKMSPIRSKPHMPEPWKRLKSRADDFLWGFQVRDGGFVLPFIKIECNSLSKAWYINTIQYSKFSKVVDLPKNSIGIITSANLKNQCWTFEIAISEMTIKLVEVLN